MANWIMETYLWIPAIIVGIKIFDEFGFNKD